MKLRELISGVPLSGGTADLEMEIYSISYDSRTLEPGALFVALPGDKTDGHRYIHAALERGAAAVVCCTPPDQPGPWLTAEDTPKDEEGMQTMRNLAKNMIWMMRCFEAGKKAGVLYPDTEKQFCTNFIR